MIDQAIGVSEARLITDITISEDWKSQSLDPRKTLPRKMEQERHRSISMFPSLKD